MKKKFLFAGLLMLLCYTTIAQKNKAMVSDRQLWLDHLHKLTRPVIINLAKDSLIISTPVLLSVTIDRPADRKSATESNTTFTKDGWLNIGLYGLQNELADV